MYNLLPHQTEGRDVLSQKFRFGLLDDMGLGKTFTTIATLRDYEALCSLTRDVSGRNTAHSVGSGVEELARRLEGGAFVRKPQ